MSYIQPLFKARMSLLKQHHSSGKGLYVLKLSEANILSVTPSIGASY